jgi:hypothetical protein
MQSSRPFLVVLSGAPAYDEVMTLALGRRPG